MLSRYVLCTVWLCVLLRSVLLCYASHNEIVRCVCCFVRFAWQQDLSARQSEMERAAGFFAELKDTTTAKVCVYACVSCEGLLSFISYLTHDYAVHTQLVKEAASLMKQQQGLEDAHHRQFVGLSLADTVYNLVLIGEHKKAAKFAGDFELSDKQYVLMFVVLCCTVQGCVPSLFTASHI